MAQRKEMRRSAPVNERPFKPIEKVAKHTKSDTVCISYVHGKPTFCSTGSVRSVQISLPKVRGYYE